MQFEQLGPYRLGKKLGQGGMGAVYAAVDSESTQPAAIKILAPHLAGEEGFRVRFEAEIESLKKLRHPNIVRLYGYGEQAGTLFYAMELVEGTSLEDELRAGRRFDWREATQIGVKLCRALKHAHDHGIIHRDLKPANLLLTPDGDVKLSDFGIARLFGNTRLTMGGGVIGTAEYMAPEQAEGRTLTDRCDQYSLGGVLYALLAGRPPFRAKTMLEMLQMQRYSEPDPVQRYAPQTPDELARIVHQLLEKDPARRFPNTLILSRSLEAMERGLSVSASAGGDFVLGLSNEPSTLAASPEIVVSKDAPTRLAAPVPPQPVTPVTRQPAASRGFATAPSDAGVSGSGPRVTEPTMAYSADGTPRLTGVSESMSDSTATRFTKVDQRRRHEESEAREFAGGLLSPQTLSLAVALGSLLLVGYFLMRPPSAEQLYAEIEAATAEGDAASIVASHAQIDKFLSYYPDDPRSEELRALRDESERPHPIQRAFKEAKRSALLNPELAAVRFQALLDVYDEGDANSEVVKHYVKLTRQQLKRINQQSLGHLAEDRAVLQALLDQAAADANKDPARVRKLYQGVIELYGDKPWAADQVRQARQKLSALPAATSTP